MKKLLIRLFRKTGILKKISISPQIKIYGRKLKIPIINEIGISNYLHLSEPWMHHILDQLLDSEKTFIDVGVNLSQTLLKVKAINSSVSYIGFEPNPLCVFYTNEVGKQNLFEKVQIYPVGLSIESTVLNLNLYNNSDHDSGASIIEGFRDSNSITKKIHVPVFNFSDIKLSSTLRTGIIKIDVEGAELEVIQGVLKLIEEDKPYIFIEILPAYNDKNTVRIDRQNQIASILTSLNYTIYRIKKTKNEFVGLSKLDSFDIHSDINLCEYIFCPNEQCQAFEEKLNINI